MSQFNPNQFFNNVANSPYQNPFQGNQNSGGFNPQRAQGAVDSAMAQFRSHTNQKPQQGGFHRYTGSMGYGLPGSSNVPGQHTPFIQRNQQRDMNDAAWGALFTHGTFGDMQRQQSSMDEQFNRQNQGISDYQQAFQQGAGELNEIAQRQRDSLGARADQASQIGEQGYQDFTKFRDAQMGRVDQDIATANQQAAGAVSSYEDTMGKYQDRTASQASNLAVGLQRQVENTMKDISSGMNPDGTMMSPAERSALMTTMQQNTAEQTSMGINQIYSQFNDTMASMGTNLAQLKQSQSQTTMAGGQLRGQMGTAFGAQTLDAQRQRASMMELSSNLTTTMEQMSAASQLGAINLLTNGYREMYEMINNNRRGSTSMYAALSGWLAAMTTPGLNEIAPPNFENY